MDCTSVLLVNSVGEQESSKSTLAREEVRSELSLRKTHLELCIRMSGLGAHRRLENSSEGIVGV